MKQDKHTTLTGTRTSAGDVCRWAQTLSRLHERLASRFARPEPRRRALAYLQGILSETSRKNGWQLAEHAGEARPDGMQRLLSSAVWDTDGVRDAPLAPTCLSNSARSPLSWSSTKPAFPSVGRSRQASRCSIVEPLARRENCQVGVFLAYVTARGHTLIDRELSLPLDWLEDGDRCQNAGIPKSVRFQTKPELARRMLARVWDCAVCSMISSFCACCAWCAMTFS
jgi:SRSO17 transposase